MLYAIGTLRYISKRSLHKTTLRSLNRPIEMGSTNDMTTQSENRKLRILMLHGYTQSGHLFEIKTKALKKSLEKHFPAAPKPGYLRQYPGGVELVYPVAPLRLDYSDVPGGDAGSNGEALEAYGWWKRRGDAEPYVYEGMESGLSTIARVLQDNGPFDGALGFSQGGAAAGMVAALLETGRREGFDQHQAQGGMAFPEAFTKDSANVDGAIHPPLKFAVSYSGFGASTHALYQAYYDPKITTPMMHFLGTLDTVVSEDRSLRLVDACVGGRGVKGGVERVVYHPGGHHVPSSQKPYVAALVSFIREAIGEPSGVAPKSVEESGGSTPRRGVGEERVEDMDVPF